MMPSKLSSGALSRAGMTNTSTCVFHLTHRAVGRKTSTCVLHLTVWEGFRPGSLSPEERTELRRKGDGCWGIVLHVLVGLLGLLGLVGICKKYAAAFILCGSVESCKRRASFFAFVPPFCCRLLKNRKTM
jgi:hypothetical protein